MTIVQRGELEARRRERRRKNDLTMPVAEAIDAIILRLRRGRATVVSIDVRHRLRQLPVEALT